MSPTMVRDCLRLLLVLQLMLGFASSRGHGDGAAAAAAAAAAAGEDEELLLCPKRCECFDDFQTVDCAKRGFLSLPSLLNQTKRLSMEGNHLQTITVNSFRSVGAGIESIILTDNDLVLINTVTFCQLPRLGELDLSRNFIRAFDVDSSCVAHSLEELNLRNNLLTTVPKALADFAPALEVLDLSYNDLTSAAFDSSYARLRSLRFLDLSANHVYEILTTDLAPLRSTSLQTLCINDCKMIAVEEEALSQLSNLTTLSMSNSFLDEGALQRVFQKISSPSSLTQLDLSRTQIFNATVSLLGMFHGLSLLDLSNCNLHLFEPFLFRHLSDLESLHLDNGELTHLTDVGTLRNLRELYAQRNLIESVDLRNARILETVDLSWNRVSSLPAHWLDSADMVQDLNLSHNYIATIDDNAFDLTNVIYVLDLSYNRLECLQSYGSLRVRKLILSHNNITRIIRGAFDSHFDTLTELDLGWNSLEGVEEGTFTSTLSTLHYLNLAQNRLGVALAVGRLETMFVSMIYLKVLDLSYNDITVIQSRQLVHLRQLSSIYLQGNRIQHLGDASLQAINLITKVILSNNRLATVDMEILLELEFLQEIDLSGNPFHCDCRLLAFRSWINSTNVRLISIYDLPPRYVCLFRDVDDEDHRGRQQQHHRHSLVQRNHSLLLFDTNCSQSDRLRFGARRTAMVVVGATVGATVFLGALAMCCAHRCKRLDFLRSRGQIRYREVSSVVEAVASDSHL